LRDHCSDAPAEPARVFVFERLESRRMLDASPIDSASRTALIAGFDQLVDFSRELDEYDLLHRQLPLIDQSIGDALDFSSIVENQIRGPIADVLASELTVDELTTFLREELSSAISFPEEMLELTVDEGSVEGMLDSDEQLVFDLRLTASRTFDTAISLGEDAADQGLYAAADAEVRLTLGLSFDFSFGVDLSGADVTAEDFFLQIHGLTLQAEVRALTELVADEAAPADGQLDEDVTFTLLINSADADETIEVEVLVGRVAASDNADPGDLADDINAAIAPALQTLGLADLILVGTEADQLRLGAEAAHVLGLEIYDAGALGFGAGQSAVGPIGADAGYGLINLGISGATARLAAAVEVGFVNPDDDAQGRITLSELRDTTLADLLTLNAGGNLDALLPAEAKISTFEVPGNPLIRVSTADVFSGEAPDVTFSIEFNPLQDVRDQATQAILDGLNALAEFGDSVDSSSVMTFSIPILETSLGEQVQLGDLIREQIVTPVEEFLDSIPNPTPSDLASLFQTIAGSLPDLDFSRGGGFGTIDGPDLRIQLRSGDLFNVDLSPAETIGDVIDLLSGLSPDLSIEIGDWNRLFVFDTTPDGQQTTDFEITAVGSSRAGFNLGILGVGDDLGRIIGGQVDVGDIFRLGLDSLFANLRGGEGVRILGGGLPDIRISLGDGSTFDISLDGIDSMQSFVDAISAEVGSLLTVEIGVGNRLVLTDDSGGGGAFEVSALNGSFAAIDLGIIGSGIDGILRGDRLTLGGFSGLSFGSLFSFFNGGDGVRSRGGGLPDVSVTLHNGSTFELSLDGVTSIRGFIDLIRSEIGDGLSLSLGDDDNIVLTDNTNGDGTFSLSSVGGSFAAVDLGLLDDVGDVFSSAGRVLSGAARSLGGFKDRLGSLLDSLNFGSGVRSVTGLPDLRISGSGLPTFDINLDGFETVSDLVRHINDGFGGDLEAGVDDDGGLSLRRIGGGEFTLRSLNDSPAGFDLGLFPSIDTTVLESVGGKIQGALLKIVDAIDLALETPLGQVVKAVYDELAAAALPDELVFNWGFEFERMLGLDLQLGLDPDDVPLTLDSSLDADLIAGFGFDMGFGVDFTALPSIGDGFFINVNADPLAYARIVANDISIAGQLGFLGIGGVLQGEESGTPDERLPLFEAEVGLDIDTGDDESITFRELLSTPFGDLVSLTTDGRLGLDLEIEAQVGDFDTNDGIPPNLILRVPDLFVTDGDGSYAAPEVVIENNLDEVLSFRNMTAVAMQGAMQSLQEFWDDLRESPALNTEIPFTNGQTLGDVLDLGGIFGERLLDRLEKAGTLSVSLAGDDAAIWAAVVDGAFALTVDGEAVVVSGIDFSSVTSLSDVAAVLEGAINDALESAEDVAVEYDAATHTMTITSGTNGVLSEVKDIEGTDLDDATELFSEDGDYLRAGTELISLGGLRFATAQDFASALADIIPGLSYSDDDDGNPDTDDPALTYDLIFTHELELFEYELDLGFDLGDLANISTDSTIDLTGDLSFGMTLGVLLTPLGVGFELEASPDPSDPMSSTGTPLAELNRGIGVIIEADGLDDLSIQLRDGRSFGVDLDGAENIGQVMALIAAAAPAGAFRIELDEPKHGMVVTDLTVPTGGDDSDSAVAFKITAANGSLAGFGLGILGAAEEDVIEGTPLHGESLLDKVFLRATDIDGDGEVDPMLDAGLTITAADIDASATLGFIGIGINGGVASARVGAKITLGDPGTNAYDDRVSVLEVYESLDDAAFSVVGDTDLTEAAFPTGGVFKLMVGDEGPYTVVFADVGLPDNYDELEPSERLGARLDLLASELNLALKVTQQDGGGVTDISDRVKALVRGDRIGFAVTDGTTRFLEVQDAVELGFSETGRAYVVRPKITVSADEFDLPLELQGNLPGFSFDVPLPSIAFDIPEFDFNFDVSNPFPEIDLDFNGIGDLLDLKDFGFSSVIGGLRDALGFLRDVELGDVPGLPDLDFFSYELPLVNISINDFLDFSAQFDGFLADLEANPASGLQFLEEFMEDLLGLPDAPGFAVFAIPSFNTEHPEVNTPPGNDDPTLDEILEHLETLQVDNPEVTFSVDTNQAEGLSLRLDLLFAPEFFSEQFTLALDLMSLGIFDDLDLGPVTDIIDVSGSTTFNFSAGAVFQVALGLDLTDPTSPRPFLYDADQAGPTTTGGTRIGVTATATADPVEFDAAIGPLGVFIRDGFAGITNEAGDGPIELNLGLQNVDGDGRHYFGDSFLSDIGPSLDAKISASLPVYFPSENALFGEIEFAIDSVSDLLDPDVEDAIRVELPDFEAAISDLDLSENLFAMVGGWEGIFNLIIDAMKGEVLGVPVPLIGDALKDEARFLEDVRDSVIANFDDLTNQAVDFLVGPVQQVFFDAFGPGGLNFLQDLSGDGQLTRDDIVVTILEEPGNPLPQGIQFDIHLAQDLLEVDAPVDFELGIPGLGLEVDGDVKLMAGFDFVFGVGVSVDHGVYFDTSDPSELQIFAEASIPGLSAVGELGFPSRRCGGPGQAGTTADRRQRRRCRVRPGRPRPASRLLDREHRVRAG
jgi:hypothetical protein